METKKIGDRIMEARRKKNLSQAQLAQQLFISPQAVGKWERGESLPDIVTLIRLAEILNVDLNYFSGSFPSLSETPASLTDEQSTVQDRKKKGWDMSRGNWVDADFSGLKNLQDKFSSSNLQRCLFVGSDLSGLLLKGNNVNHCDFSGSDFSRCQIQGSMLTGNSFSGCNLTEAEFKDSFITGSSFSGADLSSAVFRSGGLEKCRFENTVFKQTSFTDMMLSGLNLEGIIEDCSFDNCAFSKVTFQNARLKNTFFKGRSLKRIRFIDCCADRLTLAFLKSGGAKLEGLTEE